MRVNKKGRYVNLNLILITVILVLAFVFVSQYPGAWSYFGVNNYAEGDLNVTKFGINAEILFTNETFDGVWNGKVLSGRKGEQAMEWYFVRMNRSRLDIEKNSHTPGIDGIYRKNDNYYIFAEAKETSLRGDYNTPLSTDASYGAQMSDQWIEYHIVKMNNSALLSAFYDGNYDKIVVIYKIRDSPGSTFTKEFADSLNSVGVNHIVIVKNRGGNN